MNNSEQPFDSPMHVRGLLHQLPELLAGAEPETDDPAVRRMLNSDPSARAAVASLGLLINAMSANTAEEYAFARQVRQPVRKSIQDGRLIFAETLGRMLCSSGLSYLQEATCHDTFYSGLGRSEKTLYTPEEFRTVEEELRDFLGLGLKARGEFDHVHKLVAYIGSERQPDRLALATMLLVAAERLIPDSSTVAFYRIEAGTHKNHRAALAEWRSYARRWHTPEVIGRGLQGCGRAEMFLGNPAEATQLYVTASEYLPFSVPIAFTGMVTSLLAGDSRLATHFAGEVATRVCASSPDLPGISGSIRGLSEEWKQIARTSRKAMETVLPILPTALVREIEKFVKEPVDSPISPFSPPGFPGTLSNVRRA